MVEPSQPVDLLLNLQGLEVVELRLMRLELGEVAVLKAAERGCAALVYRRLPLQQQVKSAHLPGLMLGLCALSGLWGLKVGTVMFRGRGLGRMQLFCCLAAPC